MNARWISAVSIVATLALAGTAAAGSVLAASKKGAPVAFASIAGDGTVRAYGGKGTASIAVGTCNADDCYLTFTGKYPSDITPGKVVLLSTSDAGGYSVSNHLVISATPTDIQVGVARFASMTGTGSGAGFSVSVLVGR